MKLPNHIEAQGFKAVALRTPMLGEHVIVYDANQVPRVVEFDNDLINVDDIPHYIIVAVPRWRAVDGGGFHCISIIDGVMERDYITDSHGAYTRDLLYSTGNYFKTAEEAQAALDAIGKMFLLGL